MLCRLQMIIHVWMSSAAHHLKQTLDKKACQHHGQIVKTRVMACYHNGSLPVKRALQHGFTYRQSKWLIFGTKIKSQRGRSSLLPSLPF